MPSPVRNSRYKAAVREQRVRAITACEYCRQKKLKCSNDRPICQQCQARGKDCAYVETLKLPRPSKARISRLEEENRYLKDSLANFEQGLRPQRVEKTAESQTSAEFASKSLELMSVHTPELWNGPSIEGRQSLPCLSTPPLDPQPSSQVDTVAQSHGPTSAVTDEITSNLEMMIKGPSHHAEELEALRNALFANSARLSQMEKINFNSSRFDFDGVDSRVAMRLLSLYWDRQLDVGAVVYRPTFMRDMACHGPYFSKLLLNAIYFTASKYCSHEEVFDDRTEALTAGRRFRRRAMELIGDHITKSEIPTVQALLLLSHALFNWCDEKSLSWLYSGMAINMIIDLGLHTGHKTDPRVGKLAPEDIEARQRVFWGAYSIDKFLSLYQGRCIRLCDADTSLYPRFLDEFEEYETLQASSYANVNEASDLPAHNISILKGYCSLSIIMSGILDTLYTERSTLKEPNSLLEASSSLYHRLKNWLKSLPSVLTDTLSQMSRGIASPHILSLRALYHTLEILLHRPFVSDGHLRGVSLSAAPLAFNTCVSAASSIDKILTCYREMFSTRFAPYTLSYATYVSATIHARVAAQSPSDSQAHASLQRCVSTLREHQELSLGPKKALGVIRNLMRRVGIDENDNSTTEIPGNMTTEGCATIPETCGLYGGNSTRNYTDSVANFSQSFLPNDVPPIPSESFDYDMDCIFQTFNIAHGSVVPPVQCSPPQHNAEKTWEASIQEQLSDSLPLDPLYGLENITGF